MTSIDPEKLREAIRAYRLAYNEGTQLDIVLTAAEQLLSTLPKTKEVEVWRVEAVVMCVEGWVPIAGHYRTRAGAIEAAERNKAAGHAVIEITGPHRQKVPA
jgi:hypothetical protein